MGTGGAALRDGSGASLTEVPARTAGRRAAHALLLGLVFATALVVRLYRIGEPPLDFHPTRQFRSALLARKLYFDRTPSVPEWRRERAASASRERYEFPLLQYLAAAGYRVVGHEDLRIPRAISVLAWLAGGAFVYGASRRLATRDGALVATAFFLLEPFGVAASRAFHPDALMVALLALCWLSLAGYGERGGWRRLLASAGSGAFAVLVKPMAVFQVAAAFLVVWHGRRKEGGATRLQAAVFVLVGAVVAAPYYVSELLGAPTLSGVARQSFLPHLLLTFAFWQGWLAQIWKVAGFVALIAAAIGWLMLPAGAPRKMLAGAAAGYAAFALCLSYPAFTHDYYHLQILPLLALALAPAAGWAAERLRGARSLASLPPNAVLAALFAAAVLDAGVVSSYRERAASFSGEVAAYREVGELVGHGTANVLLANYYGYPLEYYGEVGGTYWPLSFDARHARLMGIGEADAEQRLAMLRAEANPRYFVVTDLPELRAQPELDRLLAANFAVLAATDRYVVYDLERQAGAGATAASKSPR